MTGGKVTIEYENGMTHVLNFKTLECNLQQDIDFNPDDNDEKQIKKCGDHKYKLGSKHAVLFGFVENSEYVTPQKTC